MFFFLTYFPLNIDLLHRFSFDLLQKKEKFYFQKISAGNDFGQLRILDGLIFGQKKIRNFVPPKLLGFNVAYINGKYIGNTAISSFSILPYKS